MPGWRSVRRVCRRPPGGAGASRRGSGALRARSRGCARRARACWREPRGRAGAVSGRQAGSGIARSRASATASCTAQGQLLREVQGPAPGRVGEPSCESEVAPPERPGRTMPAPSPSRAVQRARLCAITSHREPAAFAAKLGMTTPFGPLRCSRGLSSWHEGRSPPKGDTRPQNSGLDGPERLCGALTR